MEGTEPTFPSRKGTFPGRTPRNKVWPYPNYYVFHRHEYSWNLMHTPRVNDNCHNIDCASECDIQRWHPWWTYPIVLPLLEGRIPTRKCKDFSVAIWFYEWLSNVDDSLPGRELISKRKYLVGLPNAIRPRSPTEYGPWKSHATPPEVAMPMWPMNGNIHVIGGKGDQRIANANGCWWCWWFWGWRSDEAIPTSVHDVSSVVRAIVGIAEMIDTGPLLWGEEKESESTPETTTDRVNLQQTFTDFVCLLNMLC